MGKHICNIFWLDIKKIADLSKISRFEMVIIKIFLAIELEKLRLKFNLPNFLLRRYFFKTVELHLAYLDSNKISKLVVSLKNKVDYLGEKWYI